MAKRQFRYPELQELSKNKLSTFEKVPLLILFFILSVGVYAFVISGPSDEGSAMFCLIVYGVIILMAFILNLYIGRNRGVILFEHLLDKVGPGLSIESIQWKTEERTLNLTSTLTYFPPRFSLTYGTGSIGTFSLPNLISIKTDFENPFALLLAKGQFREYFNFENKNLERIMDRFQILKKNDIIYNWDGKLEAHLYAEPLIQSPRRGATHVLDVLYLMQLIMRISTEKTPVLREMKLGMNFKPVEWRYAIQIWLASVCFPCKKAVRFWRKYHRWEDLRCPDCGEPTQTVIATYPDRSEKDMPYKLKKMRKSMELP